jgi:CRP-like cAMP-binding protein
MRALARLTQADGHPSNALLSQLPSAERARVSKILEPVRVAAGQILYEARAIKHVYFPLDCLVSLVTPLTGHPAVEVALVGREGMVGASLALNARVSSVRAIVHGPGTARRASADAFSDELARNTGLRSAVHRHIHQLMGQLTQIAACNTFHPIEARVARWLLMTRDRMASGELEVTQENLARMLGVRRVGVTIAAGNLQREGLIAYSRGRIAILDHVQLAQRACECYGVVSHLYER